MMLKHVLATAVLKRLNESYADGVMNLEVALPIGERGDTLADFIHMEVCDATMGLAPTESFERACALAFEVLNVARSELGQVHRALSFMDPSASTQHTILACANQAYHQGQASLDVVSMPEGERGDALADFIVLELISVTQTDSKSSERAQILPRALAAMELAYEDLSQCCEALMRVIEQTDEPREPRERMACT